MSSLRTKEMESKKIDKHSSIVIITFINPSPLEESQRCMRVHTRHTTTNDMRRELVVGRKRKTPATSILMGDPNRIPTEEQFIQSS